MIIGITGIFCSGKTTVSKIFQKCGYKRVNADHIGHGLYKNKQVRDKIIKTFGKKILTNNTIDRIKLKNIVFNKLQELSKLNKIMHPLIQKEITKRITDNSVVEGALLIESGWYKSIDKVVVVKATKKQALIRAKKRKKYTEKEIDIIFRSQLSETQKLKYADYVIDNTGSMMQTVKKVKELIQKLK